MRFLAGEPDMDANSTGGSSPHRIIPDDSGNKGKKRVGFSAKLNGNESSEQISPLSRGEHDGDVSRNSLIPNEYEEAQFSPRQNQHSPDLDQFALTESLNRLKDDSTPTVLRSALRKDIFGRDHPPEPLDLTGIDDLSKKLDAEHHARARATGLERDVASAPVSRTGSPSRFRHGHRSSNITSLAPPAASFQGPDMMTQRYHHQVWNGLFHRSGNTTGQNTPNVEELEEYFPKPTRYRTGGLSARLLRNWWNHDDDSSSRLPSFSIESAPSSPGSVTPNGHPNSLEGMTLSVPVESKHSSRRTSIPIHNYSSGTGSPTTLNGSNISINEKGMTNKRPDYFSSSSTGSLVDLWNQPRKRKKSKDFDITIKKHVRETEMRKRYILKLCRALMEYGAPTHRLEAYLSMTSRVLEIQAQFLYFPGTMIISFDDPGTQTTEMRLVRANQGVDLGRMKDSHNIYKDVSHDLISVEEGLQRLEEISTKADKFPTWIRILAFGFGSATVAPFAFDARLIDLPVCFGLGLILGFLQLVVAPKSDLYASLFEIVATIITSFLSRLFGSLHYPGEPSQRIFCFSALAQSSIALILPGFTVLSAALELQSRSIVAGSVRIVFAIVYSLWIGYGLTIGTAIYGAINHNAESQASCANPLAQDSTWFFLFVPVYTLCLAIINQAKWRQMPMMIFISFAGYQVNYWAGTRFQGNTQVASTLGAAVIGVLANGYSRLGRPIDAMAMRVETWFRTCARRALRLEGQQDPTEDPDGQRRRSSVAESVRSVFRKPLRSFYGCDERDVEAATLPPPPSETGNDEKARSVNYVLAAAAMLPAIFVQVPSGVSVAGSLVSGIESANQLTKGNATDSSSATITQFNGNAVSSISFTVAAIVVQVAIGITIGLFLGSVIVYPTGKGGSIGHGKKSRSGLFAF